MDELGGKKGRGKGLSVEARNEADVREREIRKINKKLREIDDIKMRRDAGDHVDKLQLQKVYREKGFKSQLRLLGGDVDCA